MNTNTITSFDSVFIIIIPQNHSNLELFKNFFSGEDLINFASIGTNAIGVKNEIEKPFCELFIQVYFYNTNMIFQRKFQW